MEKLKNLSRAENPLPSRDAIDQSRATISIAARTKAPSTSAMVKTYQRVKRRSQEELGDRGLDALNPTAIIVPVYLNEYIILDENVFIHNAHKRIFGFASAFSLELLRQYSNDIAIDGTFDVNLLHYINFFS